MINILFSSLLFLSFASSLVLAQSNQIVKTGLYYGYARGVEHDEKFPIYLNIEKDPSVLGSGHQPLIAFLTIKTGGFSSHESATYYYVIENYDWSSREMTLDANSSGLNTDVTMEGVFSEDGERVSGQLIPLNSGIISLDFTLTYFNGSSKQKVLNIYDKTPVVRGVAGEYYGTCDGKDIFLQLETIRYQAPYFKDGSIFSGMSIYARVYGQSRGLGLANRGREDSLVFLYRPPNPQYNPYLRKLDIFLEDNEQCSLIRGTLVCSKECSLRKLGRSERDFAGLPEYNQLAAHEVPLERVLFKSENNLKSRLIQDPILQKAPNITPKEDKRIVRRDFKKKDVFGIFYGNLHVEQGDLYKPFFLRVDPTGRPAFGDLSSELLTQRRLSISGSLYAGKRNYNDSIPISFAVQEFPKNKFEGMYFYGNQDYDLLVTKWSKKGIAGKLYAKSFGKIGTFQLRKYPTIKDIDRYKFEFTKYPVPGSHKVSYLKSRLSFNLSLFRGAGGMVPPPTYFPFSVVGSAKYPSHSMAAIIRGEGTYDPFFSMLRFRIDSNKTIYGKFIGTKFKGVVSSAHFFLDSRLRRMKSYL